MPDAATQVPVPSNEPVRDRANKKSNEIIVRIDPSDGSLFHLMVTPYGHQASEVNIGEE